MKGFWIYKIIASGEDKEDASITLKKGANIITGPSDTGKSYLFSVINYVLGRTAPPDDIPEGVNYDIFSLDIETFESSDKYKLQRKLGENKITVWNINSPEQSNVLIDTFSTTANLSNENHISNFLLNLCGLKNKILLKNRLKGVKIPLSFKNLTQFTNIAEDRIITKGSPFYFTNVNSLHTVEQSMISSILEETDFSNVDSIEDPKKKETKISGKLEFIDKQIVDYSEQRQKLVEEFEKLITNKTSLDKALINDQIEKRIQDSYNLESQVTKYLNDVNSVTEQKIYSLELIKRFEILERQYLSDLDRLAFILEAESLTSQLPSQLCPICSSEMNNDEIKHLKEIENFKEGVIAEISIIKEKLEDLKESIAESTRNILNLEAESKTLKTTLEKLENLLKSIKPEIQNLKTILNDYIEIEKIGNYIEFIDTETAGLYETKDSLEIQKSEKESTDIVNVCDYDILKKLSGFIEQRLKTWNYNVNPKVIFNLDFKTFDIVISNKSRGSYGKGRRAISYTACLLGFLDYCITEKKNFSNFIVIDSPLTTFKDKEVSITEDDSFELDELFFDDIRETSLESQIVIFENKIPKKIDGINIIEFTKNKNQGRYGFFPIK
jgi:peptidoglycan hydrolase CwlO-like protein